jgi:hypothetical protein
MLSSAIIIPSIPTVSEFAPEPGNLVPALRAGRCQIDALRVDSAAASHDGNGKRTRWEKNWLPEDKLKEIDVD